MTAVSEDLTLDLIAGLSDRGERRTMCGHGIRTASAYVKGIVACADDEVCRTMALPEGCAWDPGTMLRESATRLVYSNEEMRIGEVYADGGNALMAKSAAVELPPRTLMTFENIVTTPLRDRDGDILRSEGAIVDPVMPLLWHHMPPMPLGKMLKVIKQSKKGVKVLTALIDSQLGHDAAALIEFGALRISHGFRPLEYEPMKDEGYDIKRFEVLEQSLVTVPSNTDAVITAFGRGKLADPLVKSWAKSISDARPVQVPGTALDDEDGCGDDENDLTKAETPEEMAEVLALEQQAASTENMSVVPGETEEGKMAGLGTVQVEMSLDDEAKELLDELTEKSGRVLSAKNKSKLRKSAEMMGKAAELLEDVLGSSDATGDEEDKRSMTATVIEWLEKADRKEIKALRQILASDIERHERATRRARIRRLISTKR